MGEQGEMSWMVKPWPPVCGEPPAAWAWNHSPWGRCMMPTLKPEVMSPRSHSLTG